VTLTVADSTPLIHLGASGQLRLLWELHGDEIIIPDAVYTEVVVRGAGKPGASEVQAAITQGHIRVESVRNRGDVQALQAGGLDLGESEAITLALERGAAVLCIDEEAGYTYAKRYCSHAFQVFTVMDLFDACKAANLIADVLTELRTIVQTHPPYNVAPAPWRDWNAKHGRTV
jgi:predicted nucleic acid-binding protein